MSDGENSRSRTQNLCASCSSLADDLEEEMGMKLMVDEPCPIVIEATRRSISPLVTDS